MNVSYNFTKVIEYFTLNKIETITKTSSKLSRNTGSKRTAGIIIVSGQEHDLVNVSIIERK